MADLLIISLCVVFVSVQTNTVFGHHHHSNSKKQSLIPFPRVGRTVGIPDAMILPYQDFIINDLDWESNELPTKRQSLIPFPRVGRSPPLHPFLSPVVIEDDGVGSSSESESASSEEDKRVMQKRDPADPKSYLWYGPRLGKRSKRSLDTDIEEDREQRILDLIAAIKRSMRNSLDQPDKRAPFAPRLGKRAGEDDFQVPPDMWMDDSGSDLYYREARAPFAPRLGKRSDEGEEEDTLYSRDTRAPFAPRLGRSDPDMFDRSQRAPFSPRLGRSVDSSPAEH